MGGTTKSEWSYTGVSAWILLGKATNGAISSQKDELVHAFTVVWHWECNPRPAALGQGM